jgi:hypothetical protein
MLNYKGVITGFCVGAAVGSFLTCKAVSPNEVRTTPHAAYVQGANRWTGLVYDSLEGTYRLPKAVAKDRERVFRDSLEAAVETGARTVDVPLGPKVVGSIDTVLN